MDGTLNPLVLYRSIMCIFCDSRRCAMFRYGPHNMACESFAPDSTRLRWISFMLDKGVIPPSLLTYGE